MQEIPPSETAVTGLLFSGQFRQRAFDGGFLQSHHEVRQSDDSCVKTSSVFESQTADLCEPFMFFIHDSPPFWNGFPFPLTPTAGQHVELLGRYLFAPKSGQKEFRKIILKWDEKTEVEGAGLGLPQDFQSRARPF